MKRKEKCTLNSVSQKTFIFMNLRHFVSVVPNHCWFRGHKYECGLSLSCVFNGDKALDLCNGGMIWSCCVPRDRIPEYASDDEYNFNDGFNSLAEFGSSTPSENVSKYIVINKGDRQLQERETCN